MAQTRRPVKTFPGLHTRRLRGRCLSVGKASAPRRRVHIRLCKTGSTIENLRRCHRTYTLHLSPLPYPASMRRQWSIACPCLLGASRQLASARGSSSTLIQGMERHLEAGDAAITAPGRRMRKGSITPRLWMARHPGECTILPGKCMVEDVWRGRRLGYLDWELYKPFSQARVERRWGFRWRFGAPWCIPIRRSHLRSTSSPAKNACSSPCPAVPSNVCGLLLEISLGTRSDRQANARLA